MNKNIVIRKIDAPEQIRAYGKVEFGQLSPTIYDFEEEVEVDELPEDILMYTIDIASGENLVNFIEGAFKDRDFATKSELQGILGGMNLALKSSACNPLSRKDFDDVVAAIENHPTLSQERKDMFVGLANTWEQSVVFAK